MQLPFVTPTSGSAIKLDIIAAPGLLLEFGN
jgi:hypothetical protein